GLLWLGQYLPGLLVQGLHPHAHLAALGIQLRAGARSEVVELGILLALPRLVRRRQGLLEAGKDRLERDALLPLELLQRLDQILVHRPSPSRALGPGLRANSSFQSTMVRAEAISP